MHLTEVELSVFFICEKQKANLIIRLEKYSLVREETPVEYYETRNCSCYK